MVGKKDLMINPDKPVNRGKNNTLENKKELINLVKEYKNIIENKRTDATTTALKNQAWEEVTVKFNSTRKDCMKTMKQLKELYKSLKRNSKANLHNDRIELYKTGGGTFTPKSTDVDLEVQGVVKEQFEPDHNLYDDSAPLYSQDAMVSGEINTTDECFSMDDPAISEYPTSPVAELISDSSEECAPLRRVEISVASTSFADAGPQTNAQSEVRIKGPSASWPGPHRSNSSLAGEKRRTLSKIADTIVQRKKTKNDYEKATHGEKLKILEDKAVLLETNEEVKKIELEMKKMEKKNSEIVFMKKMEILEEELLIKRNQRKVDLEIKRIEGENMEIVFKKKMEILQEELLMKRNEREFKEREYKQKSNE